MLYHSLEKLFVLLKTDTTENPFLSYRLLSNSDKKDFRIILLPKSILKVTLETNLLSVKNLLSLPIYNMAEFF